MLIAQLSDIHLGFDPDHADEMNFRRFDRALRAVVAHEPDALILSGDLADKGSEDSYRLLRDALADLPLPVHLALGNHDRREAFAVVFPEARTVGGFLQYAVEDGPLRLVVADTLGEGRHGGEFCEARAAWLDATLAAAAERPTLLVFHHPPVDSGLGWLTADPEEPWARRLEAVVSRHPQVLAAICGHVHRPCIAPWAGTSLILCPPTAPQVALDLRPLDPEAPDGRPLVIATPPGYALHRFENGRLFSHFHQVDEHSILARFDEKLQPLVRHLDLERREL